MDKARLKHVLIGEFSWKRLVRSTLLIYACVLVFALVHSDAMIFPTQPSSYADTPDILKLRTDNGRLISAMHLVNTNAAFTILYSHGNAEDIGQLKPLFEDYHNRGFSVFAYDYQGYGTSQGKPTEKNAYRDVMAAYRYLVTTAGVPPDRIIVHGRSVGGGPSFYLASREPVAGLVAESCFVTAFRVLTRFPIAPFDKFRNLSRVRKIRCPLLVIHGRHDATIPFWHGERLFQAAREPKSKLWIDEATHDDVPWIGGEAYWQALARFADQCRPRPAVASP